MSRTCFCIKWIQSSSFRCARAGRINGIFSILIYLWQLSVTVLLRVISASLWEWSAVPKPRGGRSQVVSKYIWILFLKICNFVTFEWVLPLWIGNVWPRRGHTSTTRWAICIQHPSRVGLCRDGNWIVWKWVFVWFLEYLSILLGTLCILSSTDISSVHSGKVNASPAPSWILANSEWMKSELMRFIVCRLFAEFCVFSICWTAVSVLVVRFLCECLS